MKKPYVGITGFKTKLELESITHDYANSDAKNVNHRLMMGFLCSSERLKKPDEQGTQSPAFNELPYLLSDAAVISNNITYAAAPGIMPGAPRVVSQEDFLPVIHYHPTDPENLADELTKVLDYRGIFGSGICRTVQINRAWPDIKQLEALHKKFQGLEVVMQIPSEVILTQTPSEIGSIAREYNGLAHYALIDESGGFGIDFQVTKAIDIMYALKESCPDMTRIVAGGLSNNNVYDRVSILRRHLGNDFGIDAQGKLRSKDDKKKLCLMSSMNYIHEALRGFE
jgi:hypothetical protein